MAVNPDDKNLALYCDFENIALGVRDAKYQKFNIDHVLERLLVILRLAKVQGLQGIHARGGLRAH